MSLPRFHLTADQKALAWLLLMGLLAWGPFIIPWIVHDLTRPPTVAAPGPRPDLLASWCQERGIGSWERCVGAYQAGRALDVESR